MCFLNKGDIEGTISFKTRLVFVYVLFYVCVRIDFVNLTAKEKGFIYGTRCFEVCICLWQESDCREVTLCSLQDVKIQFSDCNWCIQVHVPVYNYMMC